MEACTVDLAQKCLRARHARHCERRSRPDRSGSTVPEIVPGNSRSWMPNQCTHRSSLSPPTSAASVRGRGLCRSHMRGRTPLRPRVPPPPSSRRRASPDPGRPGRSVRTETRCRRPPRPGRAAARKSVGGAWESRVYAAVRAVWRSAVAVCSRTEEPAGRPRSISGSVEESPDSEGQGAGETQAGVTSRKAQQRSRPPSRDPPREVRVKR